MAKRQRSHGSGSLFKRNGRGSWVVRWFDHSGRRREASARTTDRAAAERILSKHIADAALRRDGVIDARDDRYAAAERRPLAEHVSDWRVALVAKGVTPKHSRLHVARVTALMASTGTGGAKCAWRLPSQWEEPTNLSALFACGQAILAVVEAGRACPG